MSKQAIPAGAAAPKTALVQLAEPITRGEQTIRDITLRQPRSGELRGVALFDLLRMNVDEIATVLPRITTPTLTSADVANLSLPDLVEIAGKLAGFFAPAETAESTSAAP